MTLGNDRDSRNTVRREAVHEDLYERRASGSNRIAERPLSRLHGVQVRCPPELTNHLLTNAGLH